MAPAQAQLGSSVNCLPGGVAVLSHADVAGDGVALNDSLEGPGDRVSWTLHVALKLDLICGYYASERCGVDLTVLHSGAFVAALLDGELLLAGAARVVNCDRPRSRDRGGRSGWNHG